MGSIGYTLVSGLTLLHFVFNWPLTYRAKLTLAIIIIGKQNVYFSESIAVTTFIFGSNGEASEPFWSISQFDLHLIFKITGLKKQCKANASWAFWPTGKMKKWNTCILNLFVNNGVTFSSTVSSVEKLWKIMEKRHVNKQNWKQEKSYEADFQRQ